MNKKKTRDRGYYKICDKNFLVRSSLGFWKNSSGVASSTITPPSINTMRSPSYYDSNPLQLTRSSSAGVAPASSIFISFTIPPNQAAGTYTGSITFTAYDN